MRRASRTDSTQAVIVQALRAIGCWVRPCHQVGDGFPDLVIWHRGRFVLMECKSPGEKINKIQAEFIASCPGEIHVVHSAEQAVKAVIGHYE